ncbi:glycosyltransferase, partial [Nonlabens ulvanivorans]|uniref:glycosyltransferase n=1 Tax=Nonlabens ulvanivorans TaxID=906888 RepID=UPI003299D785
TGGGAFDIREFNTQRGNASFVVKGYENELGKAIPVIKALFKIAYNYKISISIFGATQSLLQFIEGQQISNLQLELHRDIAHEEVLELMEKSIFYIGNSLSDGMPNTLLEAIYCGCIPIQSNPGNATSELISNTVNGYLIEEPENVDHIEKLILQALNSSRTIEGFYEANKSIRNRFVRERVIEEVLQLYKALI